jgi:hypothetical protein
VLHPTAITAPRPRTTSAPKQFKYARADILLAAHNALTAARCQLATRPPSTSRSRGRFRRVSRA